MLLVALAACGGGETPPTPPEGAVGTLAYVVTECREGAADGTLRQELQILSDDHAPVTVMAVGPVAVPPASVECRVNGINRYGPGFVLDGAFQRLGVSPDGSAVVFEVTDDFSLVAPHALPPDQKGIYFAHADGSGLRRLGPASRDANFRIGIGIDPYFRFSPDGRTIVFSDRGPDPSGEEAVQIVMQDVITGERTQVTHLPSVHSPNTGLETGGPAFLDDRTIVFFSVANPDGLNPSGDLVVFTVSRDGTNLKQVPPPITLPGSRLLPSFSITGTNRFLFRQVLPGPAVNGDALGEPGAPILEIFVSDGKNVLQLTNFRRVDTGDFGHSLSPDGARAFFTASADLGDNMGENCQLFTTDAFGGGLRQLTRFREGQHSGNGCFYNRAPGCAITLFNAFAPSQDARTGTLVFYSSCDPFGTNPNGGQLFAMRPDGTGLRQLTAVRGLVRQADGSAAVELPGPYVYGPYR